MKLAQVLTFLLILNSPSWLLGQNVVLVIIDGARYSETLGDPTHTHIPEMWALAQNGAYNDNFHNDSATYTSQAIPALWCGTWAETVDTVYDGKNTQYTRQPSLFEYHRKQKNLPATQSLYTLKFVNSLWLQSFHPDYGPSYWPQTLSQGSTDADVLQTTLNQMQLYHPQFMTVYFAAVDGAGHSGDWNTYLNAIQTADQLVGDLWEALQADSFYQGRTTLLITNDHGRHDDQHGGFQHHGDGCPGCRQVMMLAIGPNIKSGFVSNQYRRLPDVAVTAAAILGVDMEHASGEVMEELFVSSPLEAEIALADWWFRGDIFGIELKQPARVSLDLYELSGKRSAKLFSDKLVQGKQTISLPQGLAGGLYLARLQVGEQTYSQKILLR
jgi:hypothetical protein